MNTAKCKKVCYSSEHFALMDIQKYKRTSKRRLLPQRAYFCHTHEAWHLTSSDCDTEKYIEILESKLQAQGQQIKSFKDNITKQKSEFKRIKRRNEKLEKWHDEFLQITR